MTLTPTPLEPEKELPEAEGSPVDGKAPLTFIPHEASGAVSGKIVKIRTGRYGELDEHEIVRLLDTIEDERARSRFRESVYISVMFWMVVVWVLFYGPRYLWHAPKLVNPVDVLKSQQLTQLNAPVLRHAVPAPKVAPKLDNKTLAKLRAMAPPTPAPTPAPTPNPAPPATAPTPTNAAPASPPPPAPTPTRVPPPVVADAPLPQAPTRPTFSTGGTASDQLRSAIQGATANRNNGGGGTAYGGSSGGSSLGEGYEVLSDTQGVNFQPYIQRIMRAIYEQWIPLIPEEARPPLMKQGYTALRITIMPDGRIHVQDGVHNGLILESSSHDEALDRAAWGSITGVGQFPPLPPQFHGPDLELRIHYLVNKKQE